MQCNLEITILYQFETDTNPVIRVLALRSSSSPINKKSYTRFRPVIIILYLVDAFWYRLFIIIHCTLQVKVQRTLGIVPYGGGGGGALSVQSTLS